MSRRMASLKMMMGEFRVIVVCSSLVIFTLLLCYAFMDLWSERFDMVDESDEFINLMLDAIMLF